jgi:hypothetical protein
MNTNILAAADGLSDQGLLARLGALAARERETSAELVAHLAALDTVANISLRCRRHNQYEAELAFGSRGVG